MNFKTPQFNTVVEQALALAVGNPRWERAIKRAADGLKDGDIVVSELASGCLVTTENASYKVGAKCQCAAFGHGHRQCKHRAARRLCQLYSEALTADRAEEGRIESESWIQSKIETTIEYDQTGVGVKVVRCDGWMI